MSGRRERRSWFSSKWKIAVIILAGWFTAGPAPAQHQVDSTIRVLFIGNSYTYYNNLPDIIEALAAGVPSGPVLKAEFAARGDATLGWHLDRGATTEKLHAQPWDFVVLQEQSLWGGRVIGGRAKLANPRKFHDAVRRWVALIRQEAAEPVLYMTWARRDPPEEYAPFQARLVEGYNDIAEELNVTVAPVGLVWADVHKRGEVSPLYLPDGSHPTATGSYLAACVIYSTITGLDPTGAPSRISGRAVVLNEDNIAQEKGEEMLLVDLSDAEALQLQQVAWQTVSEDVR